jgi:Flp pilus assembly pilin Flp
MNRTRRPIELRDADGQTMTEYAFILVLIVTVVIVAIPPVATVTLNFFNDFSQAFGG